MFVHIERVHPCVYAYGPRHGAPPKHLFSHDTQPSNPHPQKRQERVDFMVGTALEALEAGAAVGADTLIVDPPRKGLEPEVLAYLTAGKRDKLAGDVRRIVYVSCGFDALKRDAVALTSAGWRVVHAEGFVLFPGSDHLETLCVFDR